MINIEELTIGQAKELATLFSAPQQPQTGLNSMLGKKCVVRTYSAGGVVRRDCGKIRQ